jgi:hypothetical protein
MEYIYIYIYIYIYKYIYVYIIHTEPQAYSMIVFDHQVPQQKCHHAITKSCRHVQTRTPCDPLRASHGASSGFKWYTTSYNVVERRGVYPTGN